MTDLWNMLVSSVPAIGFIIMVMSLGIFIAKPKSYWALVVGGVMGILIYYFVGIYLGFYQIAVEPAINYILYGGTLTVYVFSSILVFVGICLILLAALYNIIDTWDEPAISIWQ